MRNIKYIKGTLAPSTPISITSQTSGNIRRAVDKTGFFETRRAMQKWNQGIITFNSVSKVCGGIDSIMDFIQTLNFFITLRGVEELYLEGTIDLVMDGEDAPGMFKVTVQDGRVFYQHAANILSKEILIPQ